MNKESRTINQEFVLIGHVKKSTRITTTKRTLVFVIQEDGTSGTQD